MMNLVRSTALAYSIFELETLGKRQGMAPCKHFETVSFAMGFQGWS